MADPPSDQLNHHPPYDSEFQHEPERPLDPPASIEKPEIEKVILKDRVSFERKKLDLNIYTFDDTQIEQSFEETLFHESPCFIILNICLMLLSVSLFRLKMLYRMLMMIR